MKKLFLVHLGYYDELNQGVYESHTNIFVVANSYEEARKLAKENEMVRTNKMHIDGIQHIEMVDGYDLVLKKSERNNTIINNHHFRELGQKKNQNN